MKISRLHIWIACFAILLNALAPTISHALNSAQGRSATWVEICSIDGIRFTSLSANSTQNQGDAPLAPHAQPSQHCPFCATHAGSAALPSTNLMPLLADLGSTPRPSLFYQAPTPLFSWSAANPRAPPLSL
ncbi:MAG: DUF2946 domain-containing protein [Herbaspirillum sp.]